MESPTALTASTITPSARTLLLLLGFTAAIGLRILIGGPGVAQSALAGLAFAACLIALGLVVRTKTHITQRAAIIGLFGGLALCIPAIVARLLHSQGQVPTAGYLPWAIVVTIVAVAEEYFLRGALFEAAEMWLGDVAAVLIGAAAFAALHLPLYGWHVLPLDFAVGMWLGALRVVARTWTAPAIAHTFADLLAWWLR